MLTYVRRTIVLPKVIVKWLIPSPNAPTPPMSLGVSTLAGEASSYLIQVGHEIRGAIVVIFVTANTIFATPITA